MGKVFYDTDADLKDLEGKKIGIIGYGIQGRAQALNLRDSGFAVLVGNRQDSYSTQAVEDDFKVLSIEEVARLSDILLLLIPDQAHKQVYEEKIAPYLKQNGGLVIAHGYSLRFGELKPRQDLDVMMCAPRMPGRQIRDYYLKGDGVPAFVDVWQDATGKGWQKVLGLAKGMGFTRAGVMHVSTNEEAEIDLLVEQFLIPNILKAVQIGFDEMVKAGYDPVPVLMELYASAELGEVLVRAAKVGLYKTFQENASPTCQFGITSSFTQALSGDPHKMFQDVLNRIRSGAFKNTLDKEGNSEYPITKAFWNECEQSMLTKVHREIREKLKI